VGFFILLGETVEFGKGSYVTGFLERYSKLIEKASVPEILALFLIFVERHSGKGRFIEPARNTANRFCELYKEQIEKYDLPVVILAFYYFCGSATQFAVTEVFRKEDLLNKV
jgi:hypothetical protein